MVMARDGQGRRMQGRVGQVKEERGKVTLW